MKVIVIGAGASGLVAAIKASNNKNDVTILEKNSSCGKKILITGNGRCNYFNSDQNLKHYHSQSLNLKTFINPDDFNAALKFFDSIGIVPEIKDGYYYPKSNQAISIKNALEVEALVKKINIKYDIEVKSIKKENEKFIIITNKEQYIADVVILATGGCTYPKTGSNGSGYNIAKSLGHSIIKPLPGLVQLIAKDDLNLASGVRTKVEIQLIEDDKYLTKEVGELQITDYGISGICVMQLSSFITKGLEDNKKEEVIINFLPDINDVFDWLNKRNKTMPKRNISQLLEGVLNYKLINVLLKNSFIHKNDKWDDISIENKKILVNNLVNYKINIKDTKGFDNAQITVGGIPLNEINDNFESKIVKNLYLVGELLDVNGDCGGYNLMFAWISGMKVGKNIAGDIND